MRSTGEQYRKQDTGLHKLPLLQTRTHVAPTYTCDGWPNSRGACFSVFEPETFWLERPVLLGKLADLNELVRADLRKILGRVACRPRYFQIEYACRFAQANVLC